MTLMVIAVPPRASKLLQGDEHEDDLWHIILGDCVYPGHVLQRCWSEEDANAACETWAERYGLKSYPIQPVDPHVEARMRFTVIEGGPWAGGIANGIGTGLSGDDK